MWRIIAMGPDFGQVKGIESIVLGILKGHDLYLEGPARVIAPLDGLREVSAMVVGIITSHPIGFFIDHKIDALIGLEVILDPELFALGIDPHVGMAGVAVHVSIALGHAAVTHQNGHLMGGLRRQSPEVPLHVVTAQTSVCPALLGMN